MKNNRKKYFNSICVVVGLSICSNLSAQQSPNSNFYNFNHYLLNPAAAGYQYKLEGTASHRLQWQGIEGAPKTTFMGIHGALNEKMGIGGKVVVDQTDILKQFNASLSYSYGILINENTSLRFGISGMIAQNSINYSNAIIGDYADEVATGGSQNGTSFDAEAGLTLNYKKGSIGIVSSNLFETGVNYNLPENRGDATFERVRNFSLYGSYLFQLSDNWDLEPFLLARNQGIESFQVELNALASWKKTLFFGIGFRQEAGYIGKLGFQITDKLMAAYAYEFSNTGIASNSNGSHEFMLGLRIANVKRKSLPKTAEITPPPTFENKTIPTEAKIPEKVKDTILASDVKIEFSEENKGTPTPEAEVEVDNKIKNDFKEETIDNLETLETINKDLFDQNIPFEFEHTELSAIAQSSLNKIASELKKYPSQKIIIYGHTCNMGSDAINQQVSAERAKEVEDYLIAQGVDANQITTKAMADSMPIAPNTTIANKQKNRRVEFELVK